MGLQIKWTVFPTLYFGVVGCLIALKKRPDGSVTQPAIVGGRKARRRQFPYVVSVHCKNGQFCGGSIISRNYVITAGHCVHENNGMGQRLNSSDLKVRIGSNRLDCGGHLVPVTEIKVHPNYAVTSSDIALLRLGRPLHFNAHVSPISCMRTEVDPAARIMVCGWGDIDNDDYCLPFYLRHTILRSIENDKVPLLLRRHPSIMYISHPRGHGICRGDSGGPVVFKNQLVGIVSFSTPEKRWGRDVCDGCAKISHFYNWIQENSK